MKALIAAALTAAIALLLAWDGPQTISNTVWAGIAGEPTQQQPAHPADAGAVAALQARGDSVWRSPFAKGEPPPPRSLAERMRERKTVMQALGLRTSDDYYTMSLKELQQRAEMKDVLAMLQLAVQFGTESADLERDADYDFAVDPKTEQKKYLAAALNAGHAHSAALLATLYWQDNQLVDAYAWNLLAQRVNDSSGEEWSRGAFAGLTPDQRQAAEKKADAFMQEANKRFSLPQS